MTESKTAPAPSKWEALAEAFPSEALREHPTKQVTYVPGAEVIARLNRVLGTMGWSYTIKRTWEAGDNKGYPAWIMAEVSLTVTDDDGGSVSRGGIGGQQVKMLRSGDGPVDLGDEYKGAVTDALKKAAQGLGVALDLARRDEAILWEQRYCTPKATAETRGAIAAAFAGIADKDQRAAAKQNYHRRYGDPAELTAADEVEAIAFVEVTTGKRLTPAPELPSEPAGSSQDASGDDSGAEPTDGPADLARLADLKLIVKGLGEGPEAAFKAWWRDNIGVPIDSGLIKESQLKAAETFLAA